MKEITEVKAVSPSWLTRLQVKWQLDSIAQVFLVLLVFSLTGSTVVFLRKALFGWLGFDETTTWWVKTIAYIAFVFPSYQILLLAYGAIVGQFQFFWDKEKKLLRRLRLIS